MYYLRKNSELVGLHKTIEKALAQAKKAVNNYNRLLESLKSATAWLERLECVGNELEQFQAAIAEAEGNI